MDRKIQYHPAFVSGMELILWDYLPNLTLEDEHLINRGPIRPDLLIVKKHEDLLIDTDIARIFRKHNVIEYKSPEDALSIDEFYKLIAYALLYKAHGRTVNEIPTSRLTASIFRHVYPRELFKSLNTEGATVENPFPGVYHVRGIIPFPVQIVVIGELSPDEYAALRILTAGADEEDVRRFILSGSACDEPGYRNVVDSIYQVSVAANQRLYEKLRKEDPTMCEALKELMKEDFDKERKEGRKEQLIDLVNKGLLAVDVAAREAGMSSADFSKQMKPV